MTAPPSVPSRAPVDVLIALRKRVPLSEAQLARGTGAGKATVRGWLDHQGTPGELHAQRLTELVAFVEEMARNLRGDTLAESWLDGNVDFLSGVNPLDETAAGRYERMIEYARGLSYGVFT
ncbi:MAG: hypothetical protein ACR2ND_08570 [Solirubrobacteraceae bacterium]